MPEANTGDRHKRHLLSYVDEVGNRQVLRVPRPNYELGNAKHLPDGLTERWQLRRVEVSDLSPGAEVYPGDRLLLRNFPGVLAIYHCVHLPPLNRENKPSNVALALRLVASLNPGFRSFVSEMEKLSRRCIAEGTV